jgi:polyferredoxin
MSRDRRQPGTWRPWAPWVALLLWVISLLLGMQVIYSSLQLYYLILGVFGRLRLAEQFAAPFVCLVGLFVIGVVLGTAEFHRTRVDQPISWRVFAWTLGVELTVVILYLILL